MNNPNGFGSLTLPKVISRQEAKTVNNSYQFNPYDEDNFRSKSHGRGGMLKGRNNSETSLRKELQRVGSLHPMEGRPMYEPGLVDKSKYAS